MCRKHLVEVQRRLPEIERRGARAIAVGQGTGAEAARMARMLKLEYACLGDPDKRSYRVLGLGREDWWGLLVQPFLDDPGEAWSNLRRADLAASRSPRSDVKQLGGALVVDAGGTIRYLHRSATTTDLPRTEDLLAALDGREGSA